jgi:ankyrin repeat protein
MLPESHPARLWRLAAIAASTALLICSVLGWGLPAYRNLLLVQALDQGELEAVERLVNQGASVHVRGRASGSGPLHLACYGRDPELVRKELRLGAEVNVRDRSGCTPLMIAAGNGAVESVEALLGAGAEVDARDNYRKTALMWAGDQKHWQVADLLVKHGADVDQALLMGLERFNLQTTRPWIERGANIRLCRRDGCTVAMVAASQGDAKLVEQALKSGVDANARTHDGSTALMYATRSSNGHSSPRIIKALIRAGAFVDARDASGYTPLLSAVGWGNAPAVEILLRHGADPSIEGPQGSAVQTARANGRRDLVQLLSRGPSALAGLD